MEEVAEFLVRVLAELAGLTVHAVVAHAVVEDQDYVIQKLFDIGILMVLKFLGDGPKVHGMLYYCEIVWDLQLLGIHRLFKYPC